MKNTIKIMILLFLTIISIVGVIKYKLPKENIKISIDLNEKYNGDIIMFYASGTEDYSIERSKTIHINNNELITIDLPLKLDYNKIKFRFKTIKGIIIKNVKFVSPNNDFVFISKLKNENINKINAVVEKEYSKISENYKQVFYSKSFVVFRYVSVLFFLIFSIGFLMELSGFLIGTQFEKMKLTKRFFFVLILIMVLLPFIFDIVSNSDKNSNTENRKKSEFPIFEIKHISKYLPSIIHYVDDNFSGREVFINMNKMLKYDLFKTDNFSNEVIFGKNNRMFYFHDNVKNYNVNSFPFSDEELKKIAEDQLYIQAWLKLKNIDYYLFLPSSTMTIYPEYLPNWYSQCNSDTKKQQIINYLKIHTQIPIILVDDELRKHKKDHKIYYNTDSHWTFYGAYYAYEYLINVLRTKYPEIPKVNTPLDSNVFITYDFTQGDLLKLSGKLGEISEIDTAIYPQKFNYKYLIGDEKKWSQMDIESAPKFTYNPIFKTKHNSINSGPKLFMYRDSYTNAYFRFLSNHFSDVTYVWELNIKPEIEIPIGTDIFIYEVVEHQMPGIQSLSNVIKQEVDSAGIKIMVK